MRRIKRRRLMQPTGIGKGQYNKILFIHEINYNAAFRFAYFSAMQPE
jgi:hypothetical protein